MITTKFYLTCVGAVIASLALAAPALAQFNDSMGGSFNNPLSASTSTMIWNSIFYRTNGSTSNSKSTPGPAARTREAPPSKAINENAVRFRSTGGPIKTREFADQLGNTPAERESYLKLMNSVLDGFDKQAQKAGLQNDLALALSYFLGENVRIYRGLPELSDEQFVNMRNAIADTLASTGALNSTTDRQKQEYYEALVAYTGITQFAYEQAKQAGNETTAKGSQKVAGQNLRTVTKMSPDDIALRQDGAAATGGSALLSQPSPTAATGAPIDIYQLRHDYSENEVRADQLYKGKRLIFTGLFLDISGSHYKTTGHDNTGRPIYTDVGAALRVNNTYGTVIGWNVYCFMRDNKQLAQYRSGQSLTFEAAVEGRENGSTDLILTDAVIR